MRHAVPLGPYILTNTALVGVFGFSAAYHLALWWAGRRDPLLLAFAMRCALLSAYGIVFVSLTTAGDLETVRAFDHGRTLLLALAMPAGAWTLSLLVGRRGMAYTWSVTIVLGMAALLAAGGVSFVGPAIAFDRIALPWGEVITTPIRAAEPAWALPIYLVGSSMGLFAVWCTAVLWRRDRLGGALLGVAAAAGIATDAFAARLDVLGLRGFYLGSLSNALWVWLLALLTARRQRQREREADRLARHQRERQKELEQQLEQSQHLEAIGRLAGGIAHDFNNLLMVVNGHADRLLAALTEPAVRRETQQIRDAGERASGLTRQLLAFSRQSVAEVSVISLNEAVTAAQTVLRRIIGEDVQLVIKTCPGEPRILGSVTQVGQVLLNLAANAREAMPNGGRLLISVEQPPRVDGAPGDRVLLRVSDNGAGMPPEVRARIFEPFFTTKGPAKGAGLGLSAVHGIITQAGGLIDVDSASGRGTAFTISLPAATEGPADPEPVRAPVVGGGESILLVEDDADVRDVVAGMLRGLGYDVTEAGDGPEAIRAASARHAGFDLLVTDVLMPGQTGPDVARRLRELHPGLAVLFISGYAPDSVSVSDMAGRALFLAKPFTAPALAARVRESLDAR